MSTRPNDWIAVELNAPVSNTSDRFAEIYASGINSENTTLHEPDYYKNIPQVVDAFRNKDGELDEVSFNQFYKGAQSEYNEFSNLDYLEKYISQMERSPYDWTNMQAPVMNTSVVLAPVSDKNRTTQGLGNIWQTGTPTFSDREVAQAQKVRDENGNELDWTPNDKGGLKALWRPTIVMATYDEDEFDENGRLIHQKGDLKLDWKGDPYAELLGNREVYGKEAVTISDTLTKEGTIWNKLDPFDSDSIEKSVGKTVAETALKIAPWIIGSFTGITPYLAAVAILKELGGAMPSALKAINGFMGDEDSAYGKSLNEWEAWMRRFDNSTSDEGRNRGFWNAENIGDIVASSFSQLAAQRTIGSLGKYLANDRIRQTKIGQELAKNYMALTSTVDAYQGFKDAGATDEWAGIGMFATYAAMYGLQSIGYFNKWIWRDTFLDENREIGKLTRQWATERAMKMGIVKEAEKAATDVAKSKALSKQWFKNIYNSSKSFLQTLGNSDATPNGESLGQIAATVAQRSLNEGIEETMEELSADMVKGLALGLNKLGVKVSENGVLDFGFTPESFLSRYSAAFVGGAVGGSIFEMYNRLDGYKNPLAYLGNTAAKMIWAHRNGYDDYIFDVLNSMKEKGEIPGNPNLTAYDFDFGENPDNSNYKDRIFKPAKDGDNQQQAVYDFVSRELKNLFNILDSNVIRSTDYQIKLANLAAKDMAESGDKEIQDYHIANAEQKLLMDSGALDIAIMDLDLVGADIFDTQVSLYKATQRFEAAKEVSEKNSAKQDVQTFTERLKELQKEYDEIRTGKRADKYINFAYSALNNHVLAGYLNTLPTENELDLGKELFHEQSVERYAQLFHNIDDFESLSEANKDYIKARWSLYQSKTEDSRKARNAILFKLHYLLSGKYGSAIQKTGEKYKGYKRDVVLDKFEVIYDHIVNLRNELSSLSAIRTAAELNNDVDAVLKADSMIEETQKKLDGILEKEQKKVEKLVEKQEAGIELSESEQDAINDFAEFKELYTLLNVFEFTDQEERASFKQSVLNFYSKFNSDKRMSNNTAVLLTHYTNLIFNEIHRTRQNPVGFVKEERGLTENPFTDDIVMDLYSKIGNSALTIAGKFNMTEENLKYLNLEVNTFLDKLRINPEKAEELYKAEVARISEKVISAEETFANDEEKQSAIEERWALIGMTPEEYLHKIMLPLDSQAVNEIREFSKSIAPLIDTKNNDLLKELLQDVSIAVNGKPLNIFGRYETEYARYLSMLAHPDEFTIDDQSLSELKTALNMIRIVMSLVESAGNGHNKVTNEYKRALEKTDFFAELDENERALLKSQLVYLYNQINGLVKLSDRNSISLTEEQKQITYNMAPKLVKVLFDYDDDDEDAIGKKIQDTLVINGNTIFDIKGWWTNWLSENSDVDLNNLTDATYDKFIDARRKFYEELRKAVLDKKGLVSWQVIGENLAKNLGASVSNMRATKFKRRSDRQTIDDSVSAIDAATYFMSIIGSDLNKFELLSKEYFEETDKFLPYFAQEYAAQLTWASIKNQELFNGFLNAIERQTTDNASEKELAYVKGMYKLNNFMMVDGVAGSGKSTGVAKLLAAVLRKENKNLKIVALSSIENRYKSISETVNADASGSIDQLLNDIFVDDSGKKVGYDRSKFGPTPDFSTREKDGLDHYIPSGIKTSQMQKFPAMVSESDKDVLYIIDEVTQLTEDELMVIGEYVKKLKENGVNVHVIGLGDSTQSHAYDVFADTPTNVSTCTYLRTPQLTASLRKANRGVRDNNMQIEAWVKKGVDYYSKYPGLTLDKVDDEVKKNKPQAGITFIHHDDNDYFYGHEFVTNGKDNVELLLNKKPLVGEKSKILIIVDDQSESKYNSYRAAEYEGRVKISKLTDVQGDEYDYVVVDMAFDGSKQHYFESLRDFYTAITRARIGTKIVDRPVSNNKGGAKDIFELDDRPTPDAGFSVMDPESEKAKANNKAYKEWRLQRYGTLKTSATSGENTAPDDKTKGGEGETGASGGDTGGETSGNGGSSGGGSGTSGGTTFNPSVDTAKINENNFLGETAAEKTDDELKEEFANSGTVLGNAYAQALQARTDDGNTILTDEDFLDYLHNTPVEELILSNTDLKTDSENVVPLLTYISSYVLSKLSANRTLGEESDEVKATSGLLDKIKVLAKEFNPLIADAITKNDWNIFISQNGDKNVVYWVIKKDDQRLALPIAISDNTSLYGYFTTPQVEKINGIIPISSKGQKWVSVTKMMQEKGMILPDRYGLYVGTDERIKDGIGFVHYTKGKALLPLSEAWRSAGWSNGSFFTSTEKDGDLIWLTQGYSEHPEWRTHEVAIQKRISYSTFVEKAQLLYTAFHETDLVKRNDAREKLMSYFGWNPAELKMSSDSADSSFRETGNAEFFRQARKYQLLSEYTRGMLISEIFNFAETEASDIEADNFFNNISNLLMGQKQSALRISYKTEDVPNAKPLVFYLVDEGSKNKSRNYTVYVEVISGTKREYKPVDIKIPITANSKLGRLSISDISKQIIGKIQSTSVDSRIAEKVANLVKKNPKPMVSFGSVNYKDGETRIYPISDYMLVKKVLSGEHMDGFNSSFERYLKNNNSELKHGLYAFEYRDWDEEVTSNFKTVDFTNGDSRQWDLVDIMLPGYRLANQSMEHGKMELTELDETTREFISSKINQSKKISDNNSEASIGNTSGAPIKIDTQDGKSTFTNCYVNKAFLDKYSDSTTPEDKIMNLKNIDWNKGRMLIDDIYYNISNVDELKEFVQEQLSQVIEDKKTEFKWTIEGGSITYNVDDDQFEFNGSSIDRVAITYNSKSLLLFNGTEIYEIPYRPEVKKPKLVVVARDNGAFLIQSESGLKELFNGAFNDVSEYDYGRYQFIYGYNPVIKVKPEIFTDGKSKIQQTGKVYKLISIKANGAQINQWLGQDAFDEDGKYLIHKIDFGTNKITIGVPPVEYDLSSGFAKFELFNFEIKPEVIIDKDAVWKSFIKDIKLNLPFLKDEVLNELLVKDNIEKSLEILQGYFDENKFILGKHVVLSMSASDNLTHQDNSGERGLYGHVSKINKDGKIVEIDKITDAGWVNDSNFTEFFVSLSDGTKMYIQIVRSGKNNSKITYKETIKEIQELADDLVSQIENSGLDDNMQTLLKEAMNDKKKADELVGYMTPDDSVLNTLISAVLQSSIERELKCLISN